MSQAQPRSGTGLAAEVPVAATTVFPLSLTQESLWLLEQIAPGNSAYNLAEAWRLDGPLDVIALSQSIDALALRHETLRTVITSHDGRPSQVILPAPSAPLFRQVNLQPSAGPGAELQDWLAAEASRPFDLARGPVARVSLIRLAEQAHVLAFNLHHLISDDWSVGVLLRELSEDYSARRAGHAPTLPELPIQFADYALWQRERAEQGDIKDDLEYWANALKGPLPILELPTDQPRPTSHSFRGKTEFFAFDVSLLTQLRDLARAHGATLFMTLLAAFQALLGRHCRQRDIIVGSPMACRDRLETERLIGLLVNTHALRTDLSGDPTFLELLTRVREVVLNTCARQEAPMSSILDRLRPDRGLASHPLFSVVFGLRPAQTDHWELPGITATRIDVDNGGAKFDWTLLLEEREQGLGVRSEYSTDLFEPGTISGRVRQFETLLRDIVRQPTKHLSEFTLLRDAERRALLDRWNPGSRVPSRDCCLPEWFEEQAARSPEAPALVFEEQWLTYDQLNTQAQHLAGFLQRAGVGPRVPVALCLDRSPKMVVAILGVLKAGGTYVPIDPSYPMERIRFILEDSRAAVLLSETGLSGRFPPTNTRVIWLDSDWEKVMCGPVASPVRDLTTSELPAYVIYTSGTTGKPKGVLVTHRNVVRLFQQTEPWFGFNAADVWSLFHSYTFDFSVWEIWGALLYGGRLVIVPFLTSRSADEFYRLLVREKVTVLNQTPSAFRQLIWAEATARTKSTLSLRYVIFGGEALELGSLGPWFERHGDDQPRVVNMYGITETTVHVTYRVIRQSDVARRLGSVLGVPIPDLKLYLLDEYLQPVPVGVPGEICVGGAGVAQGYLNRAELTEARFVPDVFSSRSGARMYRSGDLARYTSAGELEYLGRIDDQVKVRGFRIELGEIESALNRHPGLRESAIAVRTTSLGEQRLVAYLVAKQEAPSVAALREHLSQHLPEYMVPSEFVSLAALPLTSNGKVDRRALPSPGVDAATEDASAPAPGTPLEILVARIWCQVLDRRTVGVDENFFQLGGHSLMATQVMARLTAELNLELSVRLLFEAPTVAALARAVARAQEELPQSGGRIPRFEPREIDLLARLPDLTEEELDTLLRETEGRDFSA